MPFNGILIHGCHTGAVNWPNIIWGDPAHNVFGRVSKALTLARGLSGGVQLFMGTGASTAADGKIEARAIRDFCLEQLARAPVDLPFPPNWAEHLLESAMLDEQSQNTPAELAWAVGQCRERGIKTLYQVSSRTHITRCYHEAVRLNPRDVRIIPEAADTSFEGYGPEDVVIVEPPHRGDDPQVRLPRRLQSPELAKRIFAARAADPLAFAEGFDKLLKRFGA
jgi:hypothetical protein